MSWLFFVFSVCVCVLYTLQSIVGIIITHFNKSLFVTKFSDKHAWMHTSTHRHTHMLQTLETWVWLCYILRMGFVFKKCHCLFLNCGYKGSSVQIKMPNQLELHVVRSTSDQWDSLRLRTLKAWHHLKSHRIPFVTQATLTVRQNFAGFHRVGKS